jgi:hypothetical protein
VTVEDVLHRLDRWKKAGDGWQARCPAHEDRSPSLSIHEKDGRILLHCHAGCTLEAILDALGLQKRDLFTDRGAPSHNPSGVHAPLHTLGCTLDQYAQAKRLPVEFLRSLGLSDITYLRSPAVRIPYLTEDGTEDAVRFRIALDGADKHRWKSGTKAKGKLYGLSRISAARELGYTLLGEGESDCQSSWLYGYPALGLPGAAMWKEPLNAPQLDGLDAIYVLIEPDKGGEAMLHWLGGSAIRERVRLVRLAGAKDLSELHLQDPEHFAERLEAALQSATPWAEHERVAAELRRRAAWKACEHLAREPNILDTFKATLPSVGLVGEEKAAELLYLALTSRLFGRPTSAVVKGPSAGGKSFTVETVLRFFPDEAYYALTGMSEKALAYSSEPLVHRHLVLYEAAGLGEEFADYILRSLLSEGRLRYETVEKTAGGLEAVLIEREGPTGLILTTTAISLHPENETRLLAINVSDTATQTREVLLALADEDGRDGEDEILAPWLALQGWLASGPSDVSVPFARTLAELVPPAAVRLRRDFGALLNLIRAHALLHQRNRGRDTAGRIVATIEDYATVYELVAEIISGGVEATVPASIRETVEAVRDLQAKHDGEPVSVRALGVRLGIDRSAASRRYGTARARGYLKNLESKRGLPARIVLGEPLPDDIEILPPPDRLREECSRACTPGGIPEGAPTPKDGQP